MGIFHKKPKETKPYEIWLVDDFKDNRDAFEAHR